MQSADTREILKGFRTFAVVGLSPRPTGTPTSWRGSSRSMATG